MNVNDFFKDLWQDYIKLAPQAEIILSEFRTIDPGAKNDHVAFRTFNNCAIDLESLQPLILKMGYRPMADYEFTEKKLRARSYIHEDKSQPKIFLSELERQKLSQNSQRILDDVLETLDKNFDDQQVLFSGIRWNPISYSTYLELAEESEYAAWLVAHGLHANHFTIAVHEIQKFDNLLEVNKLVEALGFEINKAGGEIKGSPQIFLEQSSTMASKVEVRFSNKTTSIPGCFYEFARRYKTNTGELFEGFVEGNANRIFESTH